MLAECGAAIVDTDLIARQLSAPGGAAIESLRAAFGAEVLDAAGGLDRARMRTLAFADSGARKRLEAILHPLIGLETERQAAAAVAPVVVFDVPLLVESGRWAQRVDRVWVVDCGEATQIERVVARSGWTEPAVRAVLAQQATRRARRACADAVICNDGLSLGELAREVHALWDESIALVR
jgi:dephospho-CoA kinase